MMNLFKIQNGWSVLAIILAWQIAGALFFAFGPYQAINEMTPDTIPEERFNYEPDELTSWLDSLGDSGRDLYQQFQLWDVVNAAVTAVALTIGLTFTLGRLFPADHYMHTFRQLPALVFVLELLENALLYFNASSFPDLVGGSIVPITTTLKLFFGFGTMLFFLATVVWLIVNYFRQRSTKG
ncbi:MAG: hypothetical protein AAF902_16915 [Chloroflexota bacterium]